MADYKGTKNKIKIVTPIGEAVWASLTQPRVIFKGQPFERKAYTVDLIFNEKEYNEFKARLDKVINEEKALLKGKYNNIIVLYPGDELEDRKGYYKVNFKVDAEYTNKITGVTSKRTIPVKDAAKNLVNTDVLVGNGSKVMVAAVASTYHKEGNDKQRIPTVIQVKLVLEAALIVKLVEYKKDPFADIEIDSCYLAFNASEVYDIYSASEATAYDALKITPPSKPITKSQQSVIDDADFEF